VGLPVDVMLVGGDPGIRAAMDATTSIPIVMLGGSTDPVGAGFAESLARPGKNVTGVLNPAPEAELKGLQLLTDAVPGIVRIAVLGPVPPAAWERASESLGVELLYATARSQDGYEAAFERTYTEGVDALVGRQAPGVDARFAATLARRYHLPSIYPARGYVAQGGLMSYAPRPSSMGLALANYVDRILRGAQPGDLPIDQPTRYDLIVNLRAAQDLGLTLPATFLARVDETIE
jgi:putative ABC transport system substrate-binding protein